jgi:hypothetical protein
MNVHHRARKDWGMQKALKIQYSSSSDCIIVEARANHLRGTSWKSLDTTTRPIWDECGTFDLILSQCRMIVCEMVLVTIVIFVV